MIFKINQSIGTATLQDWAVSNKYGKAFIDSIADPNGANSSKEITSIPSPFARMDLVKTAFDYVNKNGVDGNTIYHKMVSDSLDVAQIFFNYEKLKNKVQILVWDKNVDLPKLKQSANKSHKSVGDTLDMYLSLDKSIYNFDRMNRLYILNYVGPGTKKTDLNIIGATSPSTLFFSTANNLSFVSEHIQFAQDKPFDEVYCPLYQREDALIIYMFALRKSIETFATDFPEVYTYLEKTYEKLSERQKKDIMRLTSQSINDYSPITFSSDKVEILGYTFHKRIEFDTVDSDFEILSSRITGKKPLVLPVESGNNYAGMRYVIGPWSSTDKAPYYDDKKMDERHLPFDGSKYPYLTISDFFEDNLIKLDTRAGEFHSKSFFDGNCEEMVKDRYLIPLKPEFFKYFTTDDLMGKVNGENMFEFRFNASGVLAVLRIPVKCGKLIEYRRMYIGLGNNCDYKRNIGGTIDLHFRMGLCPNVKFNKQDSAYYRLLMANPFNDVYSSAMFYRNDNVVNHSMVERNSSDTDYSRSEIYALDKLGFDYIQISGGASKGLIIPKFIIPDQNKQFVFAVDLGTTNTNIVYTVNSGSPELFDITEKDVQLHTLFDYERSNIYNIEKDLIPIVIGNNQSRYHFPTRTALSFSRKVNWEENVIPMASANASLTYERISGSSYNDIMTNLKWSNEQDNINMLKCYIDSLFIMMRNKVLINGGDLSKTRIVWFYPVSMSVNRLNMFKTLWNSAYSKYFDGIASNIVAMTESVAPYEFYKSAHVFTSDTVTVDIGGETTDVVISSNGAVKNIISFRFAANSIFGDGYSDTQFASKNGIIRKYQDIIGKIVGNCNNSDVIKMFGEIEGGNISSEIASLLFSLRSNKSLDEDGRINIDNVDFTALLQRDEDYKVVFLIFYSAIVYHIAKLMKAKKYDMPRYMAFSGNGSKAISILSNDNRLLAKFTRIIFEKVYEETYNKNGLDIILTENPKEATCKGGIAGIDRIQEYDDIEEYKVIYNGNKDCSFITNEKYQDVKNDNNFIHGIENQANDFYKFVFRLGNMFDYNKNFGVSDKSITIAKDICLRDIEQFIKDGINKKMEDIPANAVIEETMFFYPLYGMLNRLCEEIFNANNN